MATRGLGVHHCVSEFAKQQFVESCSFPESRIVVKTNLVFGPGPPSAGRNNFPFVRRLSVEKKLGTLLKAMETVRGLSFGPPPWAVL